MPGMGLDPCGQFPAGFGEDPELQGPPEQPIIGATFINPRTRDYEVNDDGSFKRMPTTRHRVLMLLMTQLDSSVRVDNSGPVGLQLPEKIDQTFKQKAEQAVRACLEPLANDIRIDAVRTTVLTSGRVQIVVEYTDLTTGNADTATV